MIVHSSHYQDWINIVTLPYSRQISFTRSTSSRSFAAIFDCFSEMMCSVVMYISISFVMLCLFFSTILCHSFMHTKRCMEHFFFLHRYYICVCVNVCTMRMRAYISLVLWVYIFFLSIFIFVLIQNWPCCDCSCCYCCCRLHFRGDINFRASQTYINKKACYCFWSDRSQSASTRVRVKTTVLNRGNHNISLRATEMKWFSQCNWSSGISNIVNICQYSLLLAVKNISW